MDSIELKNYIGHVKDLEMSCYKQARYIKELQNVLEEVQHPRIYAEVERKEDKPMGILASICAGIVGIFGSAIAGCVIDLFIYFILCILVIGLWLLNIVLKASWISAILDWNPPMWLIIAVLGIPILLCVLIGIGIFIVLIISSIQGKIKNKRLKKEIKKENEHIAELNKNIQSQVPIKTQNVKKEIERARKQFNETYGLLQKYYDENIIYEDYRGLVPMCMIYQYLESKRCDQLEGPYGAYNKYDYEKNAHIIVTQLGEIINNLNKIEENQGTIAEAIRKANTNVTKLSNIVQEQSESLERIESNQENANYYNQITATNTAYLSWITTHAYIAEK